MSVTEKRCTTCGFYTGNTNKVCSTTGCKSFSKYVPIEKKTCVSCLYSHELCLSKSDCVDHSLWEEGVKNKPTCRNCGHRKDDENCFPASCNGEHWIPMLIKKSCRNCHFFTENKQTKEFCKCCKDFNNWKLEVIKSDNVNHPSHYNYFPVEVILMIELILDKIEMSSISYFQAFCLGNEIKYRMRAGLKDPDKIVEDIEKSEFYRKLRNSNNSKKNE